MHACDYDLFIIGAGPAGSTAAAFARQAGLSVLIVDKEAFPRFRIGESLLPHGNALLRESGVWPAIERAGFIKKYGAFFFLANGTTQKEVIFSQGIIPGLEQTFQVERARFDTLLLDHARALGSEVHLQTTVRAVDSDADGHRLTLETPAGARREVSARWVIDAGGRDNLFPCEAKRALDPATSPKRLAVYAHFRGVARDPGMTGGHTIVVRLAEGWFWMIPIDAGRTSVGLVTTIEALRAAKTTPEEVFRREVAAAPKLRELMAGAEPTTAFHVTSDYTYFRRELATGRLVMAGDAGGFFDPIFSSGVYMAMYSAKLAVGLIARAHAAGRPLSPAERRSYSREVKKHAGVFRRLIGAFYDNDSFSVFMCPSPPLGIARGINSIVAGHARLTWSIWWRFQLFLLVCRLQRHFPITPRVDFRIPPVQPV